MISRAIACLIAAGVIHTLERAIAYFGWVAQKAAVTIHGSGSYPTDPSLPSIWDNGFVAVLIVLAVVLPIAERIAQGIAEARSQQSPESR